MWTIIVKEFHYILLYYTIFHWFVKHLWVVDLSWSSFSGRLKISKAWCLILFLPSNWIFRSVKQTGLCNFKVDSAAKVQWHLVTRIGASFTFLLHTNPIFNFLFSFQTCILQIFPPHFYSYISNIILFADICFCFGWRKHLLWANITNTLQQCWPQEQQHDQTF